MRKAVASCLAPLLILASLSAQPAIAEPGDAATAERVAVDLGRRLDTLQAQLDAVRDTRGEPMRQLAMQRHWKGMQDYMAASLKMAVLDTAAAPSAAASCNVVGGTWTPLSFPGQLLSDDYLKAMQAHMSQMRQDLIGLHDAGEPEALNAALQAHWRSNYAFLQTTRGLGWMFTGWMPAQPGVVYLPEPESEGAQLAETYCSICHAIPQARLHTADEWPGVMAAMGRHIASSDGGLPICIQQPTEAELSTIGDYMARHGR
jgi:hypothetical protein